MTEIKARANKSLNATLRHYLMFLLLCELVVVMCFLFINMFCYCYSNQVQLVGMKNINDFATMFLLS